MTRKGLLAVLVGWAAATAQAYKAISDWQDGYTTFYGGAPDGMSPTSYSFGTKEGSCGYGRLDRDEWPYWAVAGLSVRVPDHGRTVEGCGSCYEVMCDDDRCYSGESVMVVVTDKCPECREGHFDLQALIFEEIGPESAGNFYMKYRQVECTPPGSMRVQLDGLTGTWMRGRMYHVAGNAEIESVEVAGPDRSWVRMKKTWGASFELNGYIDTPMSFKVTDSSGNTVVSEGSVYDRKTGEFDAGTNFDATMSTSSVLNNASVAVDDFAQAPNECNMVAELRANGFALFADMLKEVQLPDNFGGRSAATLLAVPDDVIEKYVESKGLDMEPFLQSEEAREVVSYHVLTTYIDSLKISRVFSGDTVLETLARVPVRISGKVNEGSAPSLPESADDVLFDGIAAVTDPFKQVCPKAGIIAVDSLLQPSDQDGHVQPTLGLTTRVVDEPSNNGQDGDSGLVDLTLVAGRACTALGLGSKGVLYQGELFEDAIVFQIGGFSDFAILPDEKILRYTPDSLQWYDLRESLEESSPETPPVVFLGEVTISGQREPALLFETLDGALVAITPLETKEGGGSVPIHIARLDGEEWIELTPLPERQTIQVHGDLQDLYVYPVQGEVKIAVAPWNREILEWSSATETWVLLSLATSSPENVSASIAQLGGSNRRLLRV
eukprot:scaffold1132_cov347-Pavlova_lutheri.AAC.3